MPTGDSESFIEFSSPLWAKVVMKRDSGCMTLRARTFTSSGTVTATVSRLSLPIQRFRFDAPGSGAHSGVGTYT